MVELKLNKALALSVVPAILYLKALGIMH